MRWLVSLLIVCPALNAFALQTSKPTSLKAINAAAPSPAIAPITFSSVPVSTLQLTGTATRTDGSDQQSGTVILQASANGQSRMELALADGKWIETQSASTGFEGQCSQIGFDGVTHAVASHNCWRGTIWFLPQIALQPGVGWSDNVASAVAVPDGTSNLHYFRRPAGTMSDETANEIARISGFDLALDASGDPVSLKFNAHPDDNPLIDIPTEIRFSDYRLISGASVPFHIQKFINNGLVLDLQISNAQINPVLTGASIASLQSRGNR